MSDGCNKCWNGRIMRVVAKCSDLGMFNYKDQAIDGYVPRDLGIGSGDYLEFEYCLDCGQIQGSDFPISDEAVTEAFEE